MIRKDLLNVLVCEVRQGADLELLGALWAVMQEVSCLPAAETLVAPSGAG